LFALAVMMKRYNIVNLNHLYNGVYCNSFFYRVNNYNNFSKCKYFSNIRLFNYSSYNLSEKSLVEKNYIPLNKFDKTNIFKVHDYLKQLTVLDKDNLKLFKFLESRIIDNKFIHGYIFKDSFIGLNINEDNIENEYGLDNIEDYKLRFLNILKELYKGHIYKMIFRWESIYIDNLGNRKNQFNTSPSFFIYNDMDVDVVIYKFINYYNLIVNKYSSGDKLNLDIFIKEWLNSNDFKNFDKILDQIKKSDSEYKNRKDDSRKGINKNLFNSDLINNNRKLYLCAAVNGLNYGIKISKDEIIKFNLFNILNLDIDKEFDNFDFYFYSLRNNRYLIKIKKERNKNHVVVYLANNIENKKLFEIERWVDTIYVDLVKDYKLVKRFCENSGHIIEFGDNEILKLDIQYNSKKLLESYKDIDKDNNIGSIDIETYNNENNEAIPYAIGFKNDRRLNTYYINDFNNSDDLILNCISNMLVIENHNMKFYAHNMSEFDGIFILKALMNTADKHEFKFKIYSDNDGKIISIDISKNFKNKKKIKISILDSCLILPFNLDKLGKVFKCETNKSIFPYKFINEMNILYEGKIPDYKYFNKIDINDYCKYKNSFKDMDWKSKNETIKYLENDINLLYEIITYFNEFIFNRFGVNITRIRTISGLAFLIFTSSYYKQEVNPIYFTKGKLEQFVRKAYYGGIVDVVEQYTDYPSFKYDVNSHYPNAMLMPMPGGLAKISSEKKLDNIFGFIQAVVEAPSEEELKVPILPINIDGKIILFRGIVTGNWWSEELKMARDYGYKIHNIISCVQYDKIEGSFTDYITDIYSSKQKADLEKNEVERLINKLLLNSLYGRLGIREKNIKISIEEDKKLDKILHTENSEILFSANNLNLVKSNGGLEPELTRIINDEKLYSSNFNDFNGPDSWGSSQSSVQYSAAVTAYARMYLNKFKNMKDILYIGGDTDSIILNKKLNDKYIGKELGKFKFEFEIKEGFYHSKKFYLIVKEDNEIIIKAKGIDNKNKDLNYNCFIELFKGNNIKIKQIQFNKNYQTMKIHINYIEKEIKGINNPKLNLKFKYR
jgi:DNA polymerase type B, organellar and viral